ncbi:DUF3575 domain-containing protein, partial [Dysgonomonas sp. Marseille-P4677]
MKRIIYILLLLSVLASLSGQNVGIKTNVLYDATTTFSLGTEIT